MAATYKTQFVIRNNKKFHQEMTLGPPWSITIPWNHQFDLLEVNPNSQAEIIGSMSNGDLGRLINSGEAILVKSTIGQDPTPAPGPPEPSYQYNPPTVGGVTTDNFRDYEIDYYVSDQFGNQFTGKLKQDAEGYLYTENGYKIAKA